MRKRKLLVSSLILAALALAFVGYYLFRAGEDARRLEAIVAELDRTAPGWRMDELMARVPHVPDAENGAEVIKQAKGRAGRGGVIDDFNLQPQRALTPQQAAKIHEYLQDVEPKLETARRLATFPKGRFAVKIAPDFISTLIPHVQDTREVAHMLQIDATWHVHQANFEQAAVDLHAARNAARTLRHEPFLISHLVRLAILHASASTVERMLAQGQPPPKVLEDLQRLFGEEDAAACWFEGIEGERAGMHQLLQFLEASEVDARLLRGLTGPPGKPMRWYEHVTDHFAGFTVKASHAWLLENMTAQLAARERPAKERRARVNELIDQADKAPVIARALMSSQWKRSFEGFLRGEAKLRAMGAGLAAERFRRDKGRWPESLAELVPAWLEAVPIDPFDGEPLRFRAAVDGVVVYSVGPDGTLDGTSRDAGEPAPQDIGPAHEFRLWNVEQRRQPGRDR